MLGVAEAGTKSFRPLRGSGKRAELVAGAAGRNVSTVHLRARRVALITGRMSVHARRYRKRHAAPGGLVTRRAPDGLVPRVIESYIKTLQWRERLNGDTPWLHARMTDRTDRPARRGELLDVATGAGRVPGTPGLRRVVFSAMA